MLIKTCGIFQENLRIEDGIYVSVTLKNDKGCYMFPLFFLLVHLIIFNSPPKPEA